jgi:hypothetical protein
MQYFVLELTNPLQMKMTRNPFGILSSSSSVRRVFTIPIVIGTLWFVTLYHALDLTAAVDVVITDRNNYDFHQPETANFITHPSKQYTLPNYNDICQDPPGHGVEGMLGYQALIKVKDMMTQEEIIKDAEHRQSPADAAAVRVLCIVVSIRNNMMDFSGR